MQQIVFNGHYLMYFDTAVAGYWRAMAMPYHETMEHLGGDLFVRKATVEFLGSARYDDVLEVGMRCARIGNSSMAVPGRGVPRRAAARHGELVYVFADPATQTSHPVPPELRACSQTFEAGEPMVDVRVGAWPGARRRARPIRTAVFVDEQKIPAEHGVGRRRPRRRARGRLQPPRPARSAPAACCEHVPGVAKIGRMAVQPALRGSRHRPRSARRAAGRGARARRPRGVLHAQLSAAPFYERAGFVRSAARSSTRPASPTSRCCAPLNGQRGPRGGRRRPRRGGRRHETAQGRCAAAIAASVAASMPPASTPHSARARRSPSSAARRLAPRSGPRTCSPAAARRATLHAPDARCARAVGVAGVGRRR